MTTVLNRLKNEPARIGALVIVVVNFLISRGILDFTVDDVAWLNVAMGLVFGEGVRRLAYGPKTVQDLEANYADQ